MTGPRPATAGELVTAVASLARTRDGARFVGVDGFGAAGKSSLAGFVAARVPDAVIVSVDDFQGVGITEWDWDRLDREVIAPLRAGRAGDYARWAWGEEAPSGRAVVPVGSVVLVEGVSATRRETRVPWDLTVWVDAPEAVRRRRVLDRDGPAAQQIWREHWIPPELAYAERERPWERVDLIVDGAAGLDLGQSTLP